MRILEGSVTEMGQCSHEHSCPGCLGVPEVAGLTGIDPFVFSIKQETLPSAAFQVVKQTGQSSSLLRVSGQRGVRGVGALGSQTLELCLS